MYKLCKTEQSAQRQRQLEEGLLTAMKTRRYEDISISDLCEQMGVPRKSFYRYFSSKDGALHALLDHTLMEFENFTEPYLSGEARTLGKDLESFFLFWVRRKPLLDVLERSGLSGILIERAISYADEYAVPVRLLPGEAKDIQKHVVSFSVCGLMTMMITWHHTGYRETAHEMGAVAARLLCEPLFPYAKDLIK